MASTTFVDRVTVIPTEWLNDVNGVVWTLLNGATTAATARTQLGLGTISTQNANNVAITGGTIAGTSLSTVTISSGSISGITDLAIADGGTGASTAAAAFDALSPMTTNGDLIYRTGGAGARLAIGTSGYVLKSSGTAPSWGILQRTSTVSTGTGSSFEINISDYVYPRIYIKNITGSTDNYTLNVTISYDTSSPVYESSGYAYNQLALAASTSTVSSSNSAAQIVFASGIDTTNSYRFSGYIDVIPMAFDSTGEKSLLIWNLFGLNNSGNYVTWTGSGSHINGPGGAMKKFNYIKIALSAGTWTSQGEVEVVELGISTTY